MKRNISTNENRRNNTIYARIKRKITQMFKMVFLLFVITCIAYAVMNYLSKNDYINLNNSEIKLYIDSADDVSKGKLQVNWKYLAAIDGVRYEKDFSKSNDKNVSELGSMFLNEDSTSSKKNKYKLVNIENVLNKLSFSNSQKEQTYKYIQQLESIGLVNENLKKDSTYRNFIDEISPKAIELYNKFGILPSITISQAILESSWGKSELSVKANNLFGIKADSSWKGKSVNMTTSEYYKDVIKDNFRSYENKTDSLDDYGKFLSNNKRYKEHGVFNNSQYIEQAQSIENAGYSTKQDKNGNNTYADLLIDLIRENDLQLIDSKVQSQK
ncbi:glycoside hydrolase family 73 protein [Clostridium uliginosum]|uniref:Flagellum-specific peptidoglycan hydrolase FlgJ n=1 Tax=Clostridium uliginosum TaxID=119641 RepID=A0A1I1NRB3_9CLOT|nr:glucosaminidase domain-containing protein [Clostridium uliginosum]SFD00159.1 Flagellum-specific peptidoglycan hydrolase FlgJ [Clostridium uliginosum]